MIKLYSISHTGKACKSLHETLIAKVDFFNKMTVVGGSGPAMPVWREHTRTELTGLRPTRHNKPSAWTACQQSLCKSIQLIVWPACLSQGLVPEEKNDGSLQPCERVQSWPKVIKRQQQTAALLLFRNTQHSRWFILDKHFIPNSIHKWDTANITTSTQPD